MLLHQNLGIELVITMKRNIGRNMRVVVLRGITILTGEGHNSLMSKMKTEPIFGIYPRFVYLARLTFNFSIVA